MTTPLPEASAGEVTAAARRTWIARGRLVGRTFEVPPCPYADEELAALAVQGRRAAYLPPELASSEDRPLLARIFPRMGCYAFLPGNPWPNVRDHSGWFDHEVAVDTALTGTAEADLADLAGRGLRLLTLNEYVVAGHDLHELTGRFPDERATWSRLGSSTDGHLVAARFDSREMAVGLGDEKPVDGSLLAAFDLAPGDRAPILGARTSTVHPGHTPAPSGRTPVAEPRPATPRPTADRLREVWRSTVDTFVRHGFHVELGVDVDTYRASLPPFRNQPVTLSGRLDVPVLVETRIPWRRQAELAGVRLSAGMRTSEVADRDAHEHQPGPYTLWCNDWGQRFVDPVAPAQARSQLADDEIGATVAELLALELNHAQLSRQGLFFEAIGSAMVGLTDAVPVGSPRDRYPCLYHWRGAPELGSNLNPQAFAMFRPLVRATLISR